MELFHPSTFQLKAGEDKAILRKEEASILGEYDEVIVGGGVALRFKGGSRVIPNKLYAQDVEIVKYLAVLGVHGEYDDDLWWLREDEFAVTARGADDAYSEHMKELRASWGRISKDSLKEPLYAPRFPSSAGAKADWDALIARALELHNLGKVPGLVAQGARGRWLNEGPMNVFPALSLIRDTNLADLRRDPEMRACISDLRLHEAATGGSTPVSEALVGVSADEVEVPVVDESSVVVREVGEHVVVRETGEQADPVTPAVAVAAARAEERADRVRESSEVRCAPRISNLRAQCWQSARTSPPRRPLSRTRVALAS